MNYIIEHEIGDIISIYNQVFLSSFPEEDYQKKIKKGYRILPVKFIKNKKLTGFCFLIDKQEQSILHCWIGGVLPEYRKEGIFSDFIKWVIDYAVENQYAHITLNTDNHKPDIIRILVKFGFDIVDVKYTEYGDGKKIMFMYDIQPQKKMRLSITDCCNMNCFFCHSEGNYTSSVNYMAISAIEQLLIQAKKLNFTEITITGGEPFVYFKGILCVLSSCSRWIYPPKIKICTNGLLLDENKLQLIKKYPGKIEFNISMHTIYDDVMEKMTGINTESTQYDKIFKLMNNLNIDFRINSVLLKGVNDSEKSLLNYFHYAFDHEIKAVHLLELLVTKEQKDLIEYYESIDDMEKKINSLSPYFKIETVQKTNKKIILRFYRNKQCMKVVLFRLSCRCGCEQCINENDVKIGTDMNLHPCYLDEEANCGNAVLNLKKALENREKFMSSRTNSYSDKRLYRGE